MFAKHGNIIDGDHKKSSIEYHFVENGSVLSKINIYMKPRK